MGKGTCILYLILHHERIVFIHFILESPYFLVQPEDAIVVAGSDIVLECQVAGEPVPEVRWYRQGQKVNRGTSARGPLVQAGTKGKQENQCQRSAGTGRDKR